MDRQAITQIEQGRTALGIELGSTRIKSVLIDERHAVLASGSFSWENRMENGLWTYRLEDAVEGLRQSYAALAADVRRKYGVPLKTAGGIGISGMMHGYIALDREGNQLAPFLTWRNTNTVRAADALTERFGFNIPLRWSIAQLYEAIMEEAPHVAQLDYLCTLSAYIHRLLSGERVVGIGEASGMFPIDSAAKDYDGRMIEEFETLIANRRYPWRLRDVLPRVLCAGEEAGRLTEAGARLLDPSGTLCPGIPMAPPEGDAGTGMVATDSVAVGTGNVSAGTSIFAMLVLEKPLGRMYRDIDMVTTPSGHPVAMVHCNNGTSEIDAWFQLFRDVSRGVHADSSDDALFRYLFEASLAGDADCGGLLAYNYLSGEPVTGQNENGCPMLLRGQGAALTLANFMRAQLYSALASLTIGMEIFEAEQVRFTRLTGHGGLFKTPGVAQQYLAAAVRTPVTVLKTAGEGGPYGMAVLAAYMRSREPGQTLEAYLRSRVFSDDCGVSVEATVEEAEGYRQFLRQYRRLLPVEGNAAALLNGRT